MTTYYVGKGGNDGNAGTSWADRKLTLNGAEDIPVAAGDTVIVGPGIYREMLTLDVTGTVGNPITYEGDRSGYRTDGVGGEVRITGSDDDISETRNNCIAGGAGAPERHYRTFRNFNLCQTDGYISTVSGTGTNQIDGWVFDDCIFYGNCGSVAIRAGYFGDNWEIKRCMFIGVGWGIVSPLTARNAATGCVVESCVFVGGGGNSYGITVSTSEWTIRNCTVVGVYYGVQALAGNGGAPYMWVYNSLLDQCYVATKAAVSGDLVEDYNGFYNNGTDRSNVAIGANSVVYAPLWEAPLLQEGIETPVRFPFLSQWSAYRRLTDSGTVPAGGDLFGIPWPATNGKRSWGAIQFQPAERDDTVYYGVSGSSLKQIDAGSRVFLAPVTAAETDLSVQVRRGTNYAGNLPRVVISQPGQADITVTDVGAVDTWNELTHTWTPAALPPWVQLRIESQNSAAAGDYVVNWDDLKLEVSS